MKHVAIIRKVYFDKILSGEKIIESRWTVNKTLPYQRLKKGETLYIKETGKPITLKTLVKEVSYYELNEDLIYDLVNKYGKDIGIVDKEDFIKKNKNKRYGSLIWLDKIEVIEPIQVRKSYGSGWLIIE